MSFWIPRCRDSHVHLMFTGMQKHGLQLDSISRPDDLKQLKLKPHHFQGEWLTGFGWDQFHWQGQNMPTCHDLDLAFPDFPVFFTRRDGHAAWVNSKALQLAKVWPEKVDGGEIVRDQDGRPTGILIDRAMPLLESLIPPMSLESQKFFLSEAVQIFNAAGFTHVRDMGGTEAQWNILREMDLAGELSLYVEQNFCFDSMKEFTLVLESATRAHQQSSAHLRWVGMKFFIDGALGSEGAWLSQCYSGSENRGLSLWPDEQIEEILRRTWEKKFPISVHALGDAAVEQMASVALKLFTQGISGELHIEHAEVVRRETILKLAKLQAQVHMQPCHWLSDRVFLKSKLGSLYQHAFPWREFETAGVRVFWGSDAPIEAPSVTSNLKALKEASEDGIRAPESNAMSWHSHPDTSWGADCRTHFDLSQSSQPIEMIFDGQLKIRAKI